MNKPSCNVPLINDVVMNCICWKCPVQTHSACSTPLVRKMIDTQAGVYCSVGKAECKDLDVSKACICYKCQIYADYALNLCSPLEHFCFNGKAF
jgi:hypothetical protein